MFRIDRDERANELVWATNAEDETVLHYVDGWRVVSTESSSTTRKSTQSLRRFHSSPLPGRQLEDWLYERVSINEPHSGF
jgi:hypothetical protein